MCCSTRALHHRFIDLTNQTFVKMSTLPLKYKYLSNGKRQLWTRCLSQCWAAVMDFCSAVQLRTSMVGSMGGSCCCEPISSLRVWPSTCLWCIWPDPMSCRLVHLYMNDYWFWSVTLYTPKKPNRQTATGHCYYVVWAQTLYSPKWNDMDQLRCLHPYVRNEARGN